MLQNEKSICVHLHLKCLTKVMNKGAFHLVAFVNRHGCSEERNTVNFEAHFGWVTFSCTCDPSESPSSPSLILFTIIQMPESTPSSGLSTFCPFHVFHWTYVEPRNQVWWTWRPANCVPILQRQEYPKFWPAPQTWWTTYRAQESRVIIGRRSTHETPIIWSKFPGDRYSNCSKTQVLDVVIGCLCCCWWYSHHLKTQEFIIGRPYCIWRCTYCSKTQKFNFSCSCRCWWWYSHCSKTSKPQAFNFIIGCLCWWYSCDSKVQGGTDPKNWSHCWVICWVLWISFLFSLYNTSRARDTRALPCFSYLASLWLASLRYDLLWLMWLHHHYAWLVWTLSDSILISHGPMTAV